MQTQIISIHGAFWGIFVDSLINCTTIVHDVVDDPHSPRVDVVVDLHSLRVLTIIHHLITCSDLLSRTRIVVNVTSSTDQWRCLF